MQMMLRNRLVNYEQFGGGTQNLVILHGWGHSIAPWRTTALHCSKIYKVTILDFPGFGSSEEPEKVWDTFDYAEFTKEFLEKLSIKKPIIIGHSFGGRIGTILASKYPDLVSQLILVDAGGIEIKTLKIKIRVWFYKFFIKPIRKTFSDRIKGFFGSSEYRNASGTMRQVFVKVVNQDLRYLFSSIKIPVTVVWGSNDQVLPVEYVKIYKKLIPQSVIRIIWGADHSPNISKPQDFLNALDDILNI